MKTPTKEMILGVLHANGFQPGYNPHGWLCYHPDRYGPCDCAEQCADDLYALYTKQDTP